MKMIKTFAMLLSDTSGMVDGTSAAVCVTGGACTVGAAYVATNKLKELDATSGSEAKSACATMSKLGSITGGGSCNAEHGSSPLQ